MLKLRSAPAVSAEKNRSIEKPLFIRVFGRYKAKNHAKKGKKGPTFRPKAGQSQRLSRLSTDSLKIKGKQAHLFELKTMINWIFGWKCVRIGDGKGENAGITVVIE